MELYLHKRATPEKLVQAGFFKQFGTKYELRKNLYRNLIYVSITVDLNADPHDLIEWEVIDKNTQSTYNTFYFNPNCCRNLVRENVIKNFEILINDLIKREVLYRKEENNELKNSD